ncbi:hypothetical protein [Planktothrix paucivesiculata]|uniref:Uncharacterized protein n=1 Tax=Planktothrix paucivesiculata PCC 9631 TaxID=671071 RepID=A0A7Z9E2Y9_9CYAN|nr:hypothetical protein [Planktothrix paucivesiculata]VXD22822.1 hypothetical protein PL9631_670002 [Planktothrix paucivesiculata PCC 9631]
MATINITNTSIQYTGEAFQGNVTFDLNITDTEVKLDVAFKVNLAAQLNFESIDYNGNELLDWCKKQLNPLEEYERANVFYRIFQHESESYPGYDDAYTDDQFLAMVGTQRFCNELVRLSEDKKAELFGLAVIYPSGQNTLTHTIEFSIPKNSLFNWELEQLNQELREEFLAIAGHKLDLWLSAELDMGSGHTEGQFQYNVG